MYIDIFKTLNLMNVGKKRRETDKNLFCSEESLLFFVNIKFQSVGGKNSKL